MNYRLIINKGILRIRQLGIFSPGETPAGKQHLCKSGLEFIPPNSCKGRRRELTPKSCLLTSTQAPWYVNPLSFSHNLIITIFITVQLLPFPGRQERSAEKQGLVEFFSVESAPWLRAHLPNLTYTV